MDDIVERLRQGAGHLPEDIIAAEKTMDEAADELERLRERVASLQASSGYEASIAQAEIERLRAALRAVADYAPGGDHQAVLDAVRHALARGGVND